MVANSHKRTLASRDEMEIEIDLNSFRRLRNAWRFFDRISRRMWKGCNIKLMMDSSDFRWFRIPFVWPLFQQSHIWKKPLLFWILYFVCKNLIFSDFKWATYGKNCWHFVWACFQNWIFLVAPSSDSHEFANVVCHCPLTSIGHSIATKCSKNAAAFQAIPTYNRYLVSLCCTQDLSNIKHKWQ